jgi:hypothetical protein
LAGTQLFFDILARDHASATFNKVGAAAAALGKRTDQAGRSHQAFGKIVRWTGGMLSAYGIGTYLKSSMQEYAKAEAAQNRLGNSYQRFPKMQNATLASFKELNKQLMLHTQFDDDDAAAMQANLGRFNLTGQQIQKLTPLVADLAQVQGTDLVTAGSAMGKAFLGNTRALKALGISYTATGNKAKDYRNIVDLINRKVGGESTKAAGTAAVKLKQLENQWGELKETVGAAVLPAFNKLVQVAGPAITDLGDAVQRNMPQIEQTFEDVWRAASKFGGALKGIWDGFSSMPADVRNVLLTLAGGTWALGKIKGSALGTGISSMFSGLKTITAGNVTVIGKTVTGTPGGPGGKPGVGLLTAIGGPVGVAAIVTAAAVAFNASRYVKDQRNPIVSPAPGGLPGLGAITRGGIVSDRNRASDAAARVTRQELEATARAAQDAAGAAGRLVTQIRIMPKPAKEAAAEANKVAAAVARAAQAKQIKLTVKGAKEAAADAADVANKIRRIQNKDAKVTARSARQAAADAVEVAAKIKAIPRSKDSRISAPGASQAKTQVDGLRNSIAALQSKTIDIRTRYITEGRPGKQAMQASGGYISGPGGPTDDAIPAWLSNGEYVIRAAAVRRYGVDTFHRLNALGFKKGGEVKQARAEAARQARIAKKVESRGLSDNVLAFLGSMSSKAALKALGTLGDKKLGAAARKASAVSRLQERRQNARDAAQRAAEDAAAASEEATRAAIEAAEKERAAQEAVRNAIEETAASYRSFASIATTSADDVTGAQEKLLSAQDAVTEARRKFDLAGNDRDRAQAARELAEAEKNLTTAQIARNAVSDKVTAGSIRANMGSKLTRLRDFASAVKTLKGQGLNATTLADILSMGPDQGYEYAKALLDGGLGDINSLQDQITRESASLGLFTAGVNSANATAIGQINAETGGLRVDLVPAPVTLQLNGREIATALLEYQRQNGG